jgi:hypothetical protein
MRQRPLKHTCRVASCNGKTAVEHSPSLGTLQSVTFKGVGPGGFDRYDVKFERGAIDWRILIDGDGKVAGETLRSIP